MSEENERKSSKGVIVVAFMLLGFGGYIVPKIWEAGSNAYNKTRERVLIEMISNDLDGKAFEVDPQRKHTMSAPMMERADLLKALYVLDLRYKQSVGVINGIRNAAEWDGSFGE